MLFIIGDKVNLTGHARSGYNFNKTRFTDQKKVEMFMDKNQGQGKKKFFLLNINAPRYSKIKHLFLYNRFFAPKSTNDILK